MLCKSAMLAALQSSLLRWPDQDFCYSTVFLYKLDYPRHRCNLAVKKTDMLPMAVVSLTAKGHCIRRRAEFGRPTSTRTYAAELSQTRHLFSVVTRH